jgi:hypothetical protein
MLKNCIFSKYISLIIHQKFILKLMRKLYMKTKQIFLKK